VSEPILPLADAVARLNAKTPIGATLNSAQWAQVPLALRERAQFSATVTSLKLLQSIQDRLGRQVQLQREQLANGKTATFDRSSFIDSIREVGIAEGLTPADPAQAGTLQDITSIPRLGLIYDMQNAMASGYATYKLDQNEGALALYPAYRFGPSTARVPRATWISRWHEAGGKVGWQGALQTDMVALKTSPIWSALSIFGTPWPPFDYGSTRELDDVDRDEAIALGLLGPDETPKPSEETFNDNLQSSTSGLRNEYMKSLKDVFGAQLRVTGSTVQWESRSISDFLNGDDQFPLSIQVVLPKQAPALQEIAGQDLSRYEWSIAQSDINHLFKQHGSAKTELPRGQIPVTKSDIVSLPEKLLGETRIGTIDKLPERRIAMTFPHDQGGDALAIWEIRPGRLKRRLGLVSIRKYQGKFESWAPRAIGLPPRRADVLNVPSTPNLTPAQARVKS